MDTKDSKHSCTDIFTATSFLTSTARLLQGGGAEAPVDLKCFLCHKPLRERIQKCACARDTVRFTACGCWAHRYCFGERYLHSHPRSLGRSCPEGHRQPMEESAARELLDVEKKSCTPVPTKPFSVDVTMNRPEDVLSIKAKLEGRKLEEHHFITVKLEAKMSIDDLYKKVIMKLLQKYPKLDPSCFVLTQLSRLLSPSRLVADYPGLHMEAIKITFVKKPFLE